MLHALLGMPQQVEPHQLVHRVYFIVNPSKQQKTKNPQNKTKTNNNNEKQKAKQTPKKQQQKDKNKKRQNLDMGNLFQTTDHLQCVTTKCIISKMCCIYKTLQLNVLHVRFVTLTVCYIYIVLHLQMFLVFSTSLSSPLGLSEEGALLVSWGVSFYHQRS